MDKPKLVRAFKKALEEAEHEQPFMDVFLSDHPEWKEPEDSPLLFFIDRNRVFKEWLEKQK